MIVRFVVDDCEIDTYDASGQNTVIQICNKLDVCSPELYCLRVIGHFEQRHVVLSRILVDDYFKTAQEICGSASFLVREIEISPGQFKQAADPPSSKVVQTIEINSSSDDEAAAAGPAKSRVSPVKQQAGQRNCSVSKVVQRMSGRSPSPPAKRRRRSSSPQAQRRSSHNPSAHGQGVSVKPTQFCVDYMRTRMLLAGIHDGTWPESVHVALMSSSSDGTPIICLGMERNSKYNFMGGKNDNASRQMQGDDCAREILEVLAKEAYEEASIAFGALYTLGDSCSLTACGAKQGNILLVLGADFAIAKLNAELKKKGRGSHLKSCYTEIKEYKSFTEAEILLFLKAGRPSFSAYVQDQVSFCFREYKKMALPVSPGFLCIAWEGEREHKTIEESNRIAETANCAAYAVKANEESKRTAAAGNRRAERRAAKLNGLKIKHAGGDGLTKIKRLIHQTGRVKGKCALVEGLAAYKNSHLHYDGALSRGAGKKFHSIWFSANTRRYRFWDTTVYPYRQDYKCAKAMGLVVDFEEITRGKFWELFLLSSVERPRHRSKTRTTCLAACQVGSKCATYLAKKSEPVPGDGAGGFRYTNKDGVVMLEMKFDCAAKKWCLLSRDHSQYDDKINFTFAFDDKKTRLSPHFISSHQCFDATHYQSINGKYVRTGAHFPHEQIQDLQSITDYTPGASLSVLPGQVKQKPHNGLKLRIHPHSSTRVWGLKLTLILVLVHEAFSSPSF